MNREEKNQQTLRKILDGALAEFSAQGYGGSSLNRLCAARDISKGIVYHYFDTKDALFLACVEECFRRLTDFIRTRMTPEQENPEARLEQYFDARWTFFREHPVYQRIFCEAVMTPPAHLSGEIRQRRQDFDALNTEILEGLLASVPLRPDITREEAADAFRLFQDFVNTRCHTAETDFAARERGCRQALNILLYGIIERRGLC